MRASLEEYHDEVHPLRVPATRTPAPGADGVGGAGAAACPGARLWRRRRASQGPEEEHAFIERMA
jgi:hypothetical protein